MRRAPIVLTATVTGTAAVLGYHATAPALPTPAASGAATAAAPRPARRATHGSTAAPSAPRTVDGSAETMQYGTVQVRVTVRGGRLADVTALQLPQGDSRSYSISQYVEPVLREQALAAKSARIDGVSGASYTSAGYRASLQSALDAAGLTAPRA